MMTSKCLILTDSAWGLCGQVNDDEPVRAITIQTSPFQIGRRADLSLCVQCPTVSNVHAELVEHNGELVVHDLGSTNGTYVNGKRITMAHPLCEGDLLQLASLVFRITRQDTLTGTETLQVGDCEDAMALIRFDQLMSSRAVVPFFQPIVRSSDGHTTGYELLGRSQVYGLTTPCTMFRAASQLNAEIELSRLFRSVGLEASVDLPPTSNVFVNSHPTEVDDLDGLLRSMLELRKTHPTRKITLEVHEATVTDPRAMLKLRTVLNRLAIGLAYDDFGAGQSRLLELIEVPPDFLKFDIALIRKIDQARHSHRQMLRSLVNMVRDLGITPLAEGIETAGEAQACTDLGFELSQGFYYGKPAPIENFGESVS